MFTPVILYTLYTSIYPVNLIVYPSPSVYSVYPCISCVPMFILVILYTLYTLVYPFPLYRKSGLSFYAYDQSLSDTRRTFFLHVNDSLSFVNEYGLFDKGFIFVTLP